MLNRVCCSLRMSVCWCLTGSVSMLTAQVGGNVITFAGLQSTGELENLTWLWRERKVRPKEPWKCGPNVMSTNPIMTETFHLKPHVNLMVALNKHGLSRVMRVHPLGTMDICIRFHVNPSDCLWGYFTKGQEWQTAGSARWKVRRSALPLGFTLRGTMNVCIKFCRDISVTHLCCLYCALRA